ncbi:MAG TPA: class I tRNA ligase family protein, partial [Pontimonas sp.]|nr:class I tRNA ligase family protein [Pontimonas sp.]
GATGEVTHPLDLDMLNELGRVITHATTAYDAFDHARALEVAETFFWTFTDDYLELVKDRAYVGEPADRGSAVTALQLAIDALVRLFAPVIPFATEEVWSWTHEGSVHLAAWPSTAELPTSTEESQGLLALASEALITIRRAKTDQQVAQKMPIRSATISGPTLLHLAEADLKAVGKIHTLTWGESEAIALGDIEWGSLDD